jgi:hypothetical protein
MRPGLHASIKNIPLGMWSRPTHPAARRRSSRPRHAAPRHAPHRTDLIADLASRPRLIADLASRPRLIADLAAAHDPHPTADQRHDDLAPTLHPNSRSYARLRFLTGPYLRRAAFSQPERLEPCFLWQAFSAAASFAARSCAAVLAFGQPLTAIAVFCLSTAPFWAVNSVGIFNPPLTAHRLPLAVNALNLPCGSVNSKELTGASGTGAVLI